MSFKVTNPFALTTPTIRHFTYFTISIASLLNKGILADILYLSIIIWVRNLI